MSALHHRLRGTETRRSGCRPAAPHARPPRDGVGCRWSEPRLHCVVRRGGSVAPHRAWRRSMRAVTCQHCGAEVPDGDYCTQCGAHRSRGPARLHDFVVRPGEHVTTPSVFSTLLPRLAHSRAHLFRWALLAGIAVVALLAATGLVIV